jgi:hypothetical protein
MPGGITGRPITGEHKHRDLVHKVGVGRKADDLAMLKKYCCEIQKK